MKKEWINKLSLWWEDHITGPKDLTLDKAMVVAKHYGMEYDKQDMVFIKESDTCRIRFSMYYLRYCYDTGQSPYFMFIKRAREQGWVD